MYFNNYFYFIFLFFIFLFSIFLKIGLSPLHLFKIEIYKGIPFLTILIFLILGCFYLIFLIFDINFLKVFFAYSTIINSIFFFFIVFSSLNIFI